MDRIIFVSKHFRNERGVNKSRVCDHNITATDTSSHSSTSAAAGLGSLGKECRVLDERCHRIGMVMAAALVVMVLMMVMVVLVNVLIKVSRSAAATTSHQWTPNTVQLPSGHCRRTNAKSHLSLFVVHDTVVPFRANTTTTTSTAATR